MSRVWNLGILAPGGIARKFASELKRVDSINVVATASRSVDRAKAFAEEFNIDRYYGSYQELVDDSEVDVIYVASPHTYHPEHAIMAMEAGKSVLCEKAVAINSAELETMLAVAKRCNVLFMEAFVIPFQPSFIKAKEIVESGRIGDIVSLNSHFGFNKEPYDLNGRILDPKLGGGALLDIGIYSVFDALWFIGEPDTVSASAILTDRGVDETVTATLGYSRGVIATAFASFYTPSGVHTEIFGKKGVIRITRKGIFEQRVEVITPDSDSEVYEWGADDCGMYLEAVEFAKCLDRGVKESDIVPHSLTRSLMKTLDKIRYSAGIVYRGRD